MMNRHKILALICAALFILLSCFLTGCDEESQIMIPDVKQDIYVYDQGDFIDAQVEKQINNLLVQLEEKTTIEFAVITIPSLNNLTIEKYAVKLGNELGIGKKETDNGILLLISKEDTKVRLEIGNGLQGILTDSISGRILDEFFVPYRAEDKYDEASLNTVQAVINCLAESEEYEFTIDGINKDVALEPEEETSILQVIIIIVVIIIILVIVEWLSGKYRGDGFGDGFVFLILDAILDGDSSSGGGFGGGGFSGGGASR